MQWSRVIFIKKYKIFFFYQFSEFFNIIKENKYQKIIIIIKTYIEIKINDKEIGVIKN